MLMKRPFDSLLLHLELQSYISLYKVPIVLLILGVQ